MTWKQLQSAALIPTLCLMSALARAEGNEAPPHLTFHASYDKFNAHADQAGGDTKASLDASLELRSTEGVRKSGLLVEKGEQCTYAVKGNLNMCRATVSLWVCPKNWNGTDQRYHHFFGVAKVDPNFQLYLYVPGDQTACLYIEFGKRGTPEFRTFRVAGDVAWKVDEWHKLDICWDATAAKIYIDGRLAQKLALPNVEFPKLEDGRFAVGTPWRGNASRTHNPDDLTVVDEVKVWDGVLTNEEIAQNYIVDKASLSGEVPPPLTRVPAVASNAIKVDGLLDEAAWAEAGSVPIRIKPNGFPHDNESSAMLLRGPEALHVGFRGPAQTRPLVSNATRDGALWEDDSFELLLWPADAPDKEFHFIVNAKGTVYDALGVVPGWNADVACAGHEGKEGWSVELSIPWAALGAKAPEPGAVWHANLCRNWQNPPPASPTYTAWAPFQDLYSGGKGELLFADAGAVRLALGDDLNAGSFVLDAATTGGVPLSGAVEATAKGREPLSRTLELQAKKVAELKASLIGFKDGVLSVAVTDPATKAPWARWASRLYVKEPIEVEYVPEVLGKLLTLRVDFGNLDPKRAEALRAGKATLVVKATGPRPDVATAARFAVKDMRGEFTFPLRWVDGNYRFDYTLETEGNAPLTTSGSLLKPPTPWLTSNSGVTNQVLDPWLPMRYEDGTVSCWNREYRLDGPLPVSMRNGGKDILAGPVTLTMKTDKGASRLKVVGNQETLREPQRAEWRGTGDFGALGGLASWETWMEYDGLVVTDLILYPPQGGWDIESLEMDIPLRADLAQYIRNPQRIPRGDSWDGKTWKAGFQPYVWIGTETEGFDYFFDSDANWLSGAADKPVTLEVGAATARLRMQIIMSKAKAEKPMVYRFGFQATPVRPLMQDWRGVHQNSHWMKHLNYIGYSESQSTQFALYDVAHPELFKADLAKRMADPVKSKVPVLWYGGATCGPNKNPTYDFFAPVWRNPFVGGFFNLKRAPHPLKPEGDKTPYDLVGVSQASGWTDFLMYQAERLTTEYGQTSFYTDMDRLYSDSNPLHGTGYTDAFGRSGPSYAIVERRQFYKRLTTIARNAPNGPGVYMAHAHDNLVLPYHSWADMFYPGENYTHQTFQKPYFYINELDPLAYRVELASKASGVNHVLLSELVRGSGDPQHGKVPEYTESILAMCLVNDVVTSAAYLHDPSVEAYWGLRMRLGIEEDATRFIGYWEDGSPKAEPETVWASVYFPSGRNPVIVLANRGKETVDAKVAIDPQALGLAGKNDYRPRRTPRKGYCRQGRHA